MKKYIALLSLFAVPMMALAQQGTLQGVLARIKGLLDALIPILITLAVVYFFFGLAQYILKADEEKDKGRDKMVWGVIALFVMLSVFGLVAVLGRSLGISQDTTVDLPFVPNANQNQFR